MNSGGEKKSFGDRFPKNYGYSFLLCICIIIAYAIYNYLAADNTTEATMAGIGGFALIFLGPFIAGFSALPIAGIVTAIGY